MIGPQMDPPGSVPRVRKDNAHYGSTVFYFHELKVTGYVKLVWK